MRRAAMLSLILTAAATTPTWAQQQPMCAPRDEVVRELNAQFSETPVSHGLTGDGMLLEVFASPQGSWTAVLSEPKGVSCLVSGGQAWESIDQSSRTGTNVSKNGGRAGESRM